MFSNSSEFIYRTSLLGVTISTRLQQTYYQQQQHMSHFLTNHFTNQQHHPLLTMLTCAVLSTVWRCCLAETIIEFHKSNWATPDFNQDRLCILFLARVLAKALNLLFSPCIVFSKFLQFLWFDMGKVFQGLAKALSKYKRPKMKRDARGHQKCSLFQKKTAFLAGISFLFRPFVFR